MTWEELKEKAKELGFTISYYLKDYDGVEKAPKKPLKYLLNGISANTMFYLINKEKMDSIEFIEKRDHNHLDIPYDNDDLSRCVDASLFFGWNGKDIQKAIDVAKDMNLGAHFISFLK